MTSENKFSIKLAVSGFVIALALGIYACYLQTHHIEPKLSMILFVGLCPFSLGSGAFDNSNLLGVIVGWFGIALGNAYLYAVVGRRIRSRFEKRHHP